MKTTTLIALATLFTFPTFASEAPQADNQEVEQVQVVEETNEFGVILGGWSEHFIDDSRWCYDGECHSDFNENNKAFGVEYNNWSVVKFQNSYAEDGLAVYYTWEPEMTNFKYAEFGLRLGLVHGYEHTPVGKPMWGMKVIPLITPVVELKPFVDLDYLNHVHADLAVMAGGKGTTVGMLNVKAVF